MRNGAPLYHDFDTLLGVLEVPDHIDEQAGWGPKAHNNFMPRQRAARACAGGSLDTDARSRPARSARTSRSGSRASATGRTTSSTRASTRPD